MDLTLDPILQQISNLYKRQKKICNTLNFPMQQKHVAYWPLYFLVYSYNLLHLSNCIYATCQCVSAPVCFISDTWDETVGR